MLPWVCISNGRTVRRVSKGQISVHGLDQNKKCFSRNDVHSKVNFFFGHDDLWEIGEELDYILILVKLHAALQTLLAIQALIHGSKWPFIILHKDVNLYPPMLPREHCNNVHLFRSGLSIWFSTISIEDTSTSSTHQHGTHDIYVKRSLLIKLAVDYRYNKMK